MKFEEQFPELKDYRVVMNSTGQSSNLINISKDSMMEQCLSKQRVKEALLKYSDYNGLYYMDLVYEELGLEDLENE